MKILFLYPINEGYFRCPVGLTLLMTIAEKEGFEVKLFDTTFIAAEDNIDSKLREKRGDTKPIEMGHMSPSSKTKGVFLITPIALPATAAKI